MFGARSSSEIGIADLVGLPEAAARLGLHRATVNEMVQDGRLQAHRIGPNWFVARDELDIFARSYVRPRNAPRRRPRHVGLPDSSVAILELLADWGDASAAELSKVIDLVEGNVRKHLVLMEVDELVKRDEFGTWSLTVSGCDRLRRIHEVRS